MASCDVCFCDNFVSASVSFLGKEDSSCINYSTLSLRWFLFCVWVSEGILIVRPFDIFFVVVIVVTSLACLPLHWGCPPCNYCNYFPYHGSFLSPHHKRFSKYFFMMTLLHSAAHLIYSSLVEVWNINVQHILYIESLRTQWDIQMKKSL